jgi:hypothetical protein
MAKYIITFLIVTMFYHSGAQQIRVEAGAGYGQYSMNGLKDLNTTYLSHLVVKAKITDNFPIRPFFSGSILYYAPKTFYFGPVLGFASTGSRISYEDFSGGLVLDNILTSLYGGLRLGFVLSDKKLTFSQENSIYYAISRLKMYEKILTHEDARRFKSISPQFEPGIKVSYNLQRFEIGLKAGYLIDFKGKNKLAGDSSQTLVTGSDRKPVTNNWSGFRLGATLGFTPWYCKQ